MSFSFVKQKNFQKILLFNFIWINLSEIFRYFLFIMPMMRETFPQIDNIADMNIFIFLVWGVWDMILVFSVCLFTKLYLTYFGYNLKNTLWVGTILWLTIFVILWLGLFNMGLATLSILAIALPLSWLELVIAALIVRRCFED